MQEIQEVNDGEVWQTPETLEDLAITANEEHDACIGAAGNAVEHAIKAGHALIKAKEQVPYGKWGDWLETNCRFSQPTASRYVKIASNYSRVNNLESVRQAMAMLAAPSEEEEDTEDTEKEKKKEARKAKKAAEKAARLAAAEEAYNEIERNGGASWRIIHGDCVKVLKDEIKPGSVRLVFADPPYNIGIDYGDHHNDSMGDGEYRDWCRDWMRAAAETLTADGSMWVMINHEWAADFEFILRDDCGLWIRDWITWYETFGVNCTRKFNRCSRRIFHAVVNPDRFVFNEEAVSRKSDRQTIYDDPRANPDGKIWDDVWGINPDIPRLAGTHGERLAEFPTQLPVKLLRAVVGCASDPGDLVVDPFSGSATTGVAAIDLRRMYIGIEKSEKFRELSYKRMLGLRDLWDRDNNERQDDAR